MINVLIVDDHPLVRLGMKRLLEDVHDINVVGEAESGEVAIDLVVKYKPDVILLDLKLPGINGLDTLRRMMRGNSKVKFIIVTVCSGGPFPDRLVRAGALGYLTKDAGNKELITAIRRVAEGKPYISAEIALKMALQQVCNASKSPFAQLSERELQVMYMVTKGMKINEIAEKLCLSPKTVNTYRYRLHEKLGVKNDVELTHLAICFGLLEEEGYCDKYLKRESSGS